MRTTLSHMLRMMDSPACLCTLIVRTQEVRCGRFDIRFTTRTSLMSNAWGACMNNAQHKLDSGEIKIELPGNRTLTITASLKESPNHNQNAHGGMYISEVATGRPAACKPIPARSAATISFIKLKRKPKSLNPRVRGLGPGLDGGLARLRQESLGSGRGSWGVT